MSHEYFYEEIRGHIRALIELFLEGGYPPSVIDEVMDNLKKAYKPLFEFRNGGDMKSIFKLRDEIITMISPADKTIDEVIGSYRSGDYAKEER